MAKRSTNFHRPPKHANIFAIAQDLLNMSDEDIVAMAERIRTAAADAEQRRIAAATWRVCWRKTAADDWTVEYFASRALAYDRKHVLRSRYCAAIVQWRDAAGRWN